MKIYNKPTMKISSFIAENVVTSSSTGEQSDKLAQWQNATNGEIVQKNITAMEVIKYTF